MAEGVYQAKDVAKPELIEINDVVKYIKQELIDKVRAYFTKSGRSYSPAEAKGPDAYDNNGQGRDAEAQKYIDENSTIVQELIGDGKKGNLIKASEVVAVLQQLIQQLARFRIFTTAGRKRYNKRGSCKHGCCHRTYGPYFNDLPSTSGYLFLPAKSQQYVNDIQKTVGNTIRKDAVKNTKDNIETSNSTYGISAGQQINAQNFKNYITALYNEWQYFVSNNVIQYYTEECHKSVCHIHIHHDSSRR